MLEPEELLEDVIAFFQPKLLVGQQVLVTAGPTFEAIDPVRGITNHRPAARWALPSRARRARPAPRSRWWPDRCSLPTPRGVRRIDVTSAREMLAATLAKSRVADVFIATAAVADWRPRQRSDAEDQEGRLRRRRRR